MTDIDINIQAAEEAHKISVEELASWLAGQTWSDFAVSLAKFYSERGFLSMKQELSARSMYTKCYIRNAKKSAAKEGPAAPAIAPAPIGMHRRPSDAAVIKVYRTQAGHLAAKELVQTDMLGLEWEFQYRGKAGLKELTETTLMEMDEARKFGRITSRCINCLAKLSDERSLAAGYGPKCAQNHGWWYPKMAEAMEIIAREGLLLESGAA
jgi:hypothetical protein